MGNITKISTKGMSREEWLNQRQYGIGGSDVGSIMGIDKYKPAVKLFHQKIGLWNTDETDNIPAFIGRVSEEYIYDTFWKHWDYNTHDPDQVMYNYQNNNVMRTAERVDAIIVNDSFPWLRANIDYEIQDYDGRGKGVLELKTGMSNHWIQYEGDIPTTYLFQLYTYMLVCDYQFGEIFGLLDGRNMRIFPYERNNSIEEMILEQTEKFWIKVEKAKEIVKTEKSHDKRLSLIAPLEPDIESTESAEKFLKEWNRTFPPEHKQESTRWTELLRYYYKSSHDKAKYFEEKKTKSGNIIRNYMRKYGLMEIELNDGKKITHRKGTLRVPKIKE